MCDEEKIRPVRQNIKSHHDAINPKKEKKKREKKYKAHAHLIEDTKKISHYVRSFREIFIALNLICASFV